MSLARANSKKHQILYAAPLSKEEMIVDFFLAHKDFFAAAFLLKSFKTDVLNQSKSLQALENEFQKILGNLARYQNDYYDLAVYSDEHRHDKKPNNLYHPIVYPVICALVAKSFAAYKQAIVGREDVGPEIHLGGIANHNPAPLKQFLAHYPELIDFFYDNLVTFKEIAEKFAEKCGKSIEFYKNNTENQRIQSEKYQLELRRAARRKQHAMDDYLALHLRHFSCEELIALKKALTATQLLDYKNYQSVSRIILETPDMKDIGIILKNVRIGLKAMNETLSSSLSLFTPSTNTVCKPGKLRRVFSFFKSEKREKKCRKTKSLTNLLKK